MIDRSIPLNHIQARTLVQMWHMEPVIRACASRIMQALFNGGINVTDGQNPNEEKNMSTPEFQDYLHDYWTTFGCDVVKNFMLFGFCPYIICKKRISKRPVRWVEYPVALPFETYEVRVECDENYELQYKVFRRNFNQQPINLSKPDERVKLGFFGMSSQPDMRGTFQTDLCSLIQTIQNTDEHEEYALRAESIRTHPTLFIQNQPDSRKFEQVSHMRAFDDDDIDGAHQDQKRRKLFNSYEVMMDSRGLSDQTGGAKPAFSSRTGRIFPSHRRLWENNIFAIPDGTEFANNVPKPEARSDIVGLIEHKEELICATLGVPRNMLFATFKGTGSEAQSESQSETFRRTVDCYKESMLRMMNQIYQEIFSDSSEQIALPGKPISALSDILTCYDRGLINGETMARYCTRSMGVSANDIDRKRVSQFDKHHVTTIMKNPVPQELSRANADTSDDKNKNPTSKKKSAKK